jgi:type II secretory pathway pseudopilin PulG
MKYRRLNRFKPVHPDAGITLVEALISAVMFSLAAFVVVPTFTQFQLQAATNEDRSAAVAVSQQVLDAVRRADTATLPSSGSVTTLPDGTSTSSLNYRGESFKATITYCQTSSLCNANSRQVIVQVAQNGRTIYTVETLFTKFE